MFGWGRCMTNRVWFTGPAVSLALLHGIPSHLLLNVDELLFLLQPWRHTFWFFRVWTFGRPGHFI